ncbi:MAG: DUF5615 family PIN-like protein [Ignavibacteria bacterium]|nr:DUF5615 family PIN-like protein [Ignavibacteria bacterium]
MTNGSDDLTWNYAKKNRLTIISIDADFSNRILLEDPGSSIH